MANISNTTAIIILDTINLEAKANTLKITTSQVLGKQAVYMNGTNPIISTAIDYSEAIGKVTFTVANTVKNNRNLIALSQVGKVGNLQGTIISKDNPESTLMYTLEGMCITNKLEFNFSADNSDVDVELSGVVKLAKA